jgi:transcriptional regulator with XRE-family HTH domain
VIKPIDPIKRDWLKQARKAKKMNTEEVAKKFGVSSTHYNDIENGRRNPSIQLSMEIAKFFDLPLEKFLEERTKFMKSED